MKKKKPKKIPTLREKLANFDQEILIADGFDPAFIGIGCRCGQPMLAVYDREKCIKVLMKDMTREEAVEYFDFNVEGAWVGEKTPIFVDKL